MSAHEKGLKAGQHAAMVSNGCGLTIDGEHVFCDDPRADDPASECSCKEDSKAAITAYLATLDTGEEPAERFDLVPDRQPPFMGMLKSSDGEWVRYTDHAATIAALQAKVERAEAAKAELLDGLKPFAETGKVAVRESALDNDLSSNQRFRVKYFRRARTLIEKHGGDK